MHPAAVVVLLRDPLPAPEPLRDLAPGEPFRLAFERHRTIAPVAGSRIRVSTAFFSIQPSVATTARSCASTMGPSPPTIAIRETDLGALSVTSRPGPAGA